MFTIAGSSNVGTKKSVNQDAYCALAAESDLGPCALFVVCDGVGGLSSGELASTTVVQEFARWFEEGFSAYMAANVSKGSVSLNGVVGVWSQMLEGLNQRIGSYGRSHSARMGTTFSGILICQGSYVIGQVGDCRIYRIHDGEAQQLTQDQTLAAQAVAAGTLTKEEALSDPRGSVLLQSVGTQSELHPVFSSGKLEPGMLYLLCCDGFYRRLGDLGIGQAFDGVDPQDEDALQRVVEGLIEQDMARGEKDNLTALVFSAAAEEADTALLDDEDPTMLVDDDSDEPTVVAGGESDEATTLVDAADEATAMVDPADEATTLVEPADEPTDVLAGTAKPAPAHAAPAHAADAPTSLLDDEATTSPEGGDAPWRA